MIVPLTRNKNRQGAKESSESVSETCKEKAEERDFSNQEIIHPKIPNGPMPLMTMLQSSDELKTCPKQLHEDSVSAMPTTCCNGCDSEVQLVEEDSVNSQHKDLDNNKCLLEECGRLSENRCETSEASDKDWPNSSDDSMLLVKMSPESEMKKADSEVVHQSIVSSSHKGSTTHTLVNEHSYESDQICPMLMKITMLSADELKAVEWRFNSNAKS